MEREGENSLGPDIAILVLALAGFCLNLWLLFHRYTDLADGIAGCGGGSCDEVLTSRWSMLFGVPVTLFGGLAYCVLMLSLTDRGEICHKPVLGLIAGAACWFLFAQAVLLGKFCPWCMAAHAVGITLVLIAMFRLGFHAAWKTVGVWSIAAFLGIGLIQIYGPLPASHKMEDAVSAMPDAPVQARGAGRIVAFDGGRKSYNVRSLPRIGSEDATHILVEYFDYQCPACRTMSGYLEALVAKYPKDVAVLLLPMPLDADCNPHAPAASQHPGSCTIARIALAVWKQHPESFAAFHHSLIADPSIDSARKLAENAISNETDPWIEDLLRANIADWHAFSSTTNKLPKLLVRDKRILHGLPSGEADFIRVMASELGLQ